MLKKKLDRINLLEAKEISLVKERLAYPMLLLIKFCAMRILLHKKKKRRKRAKFISRNSKFPASLSTCKSPHL